MKILYVEDGETYQRTMRRLVARMGHELISAFTCTEGYELAKLTVDLILLDINLPDGNGLDLARKLSAENAKTPILVISGDVMGYSREDVLKAGCSELIAKPIEPPFMEKMIEQYLPQSQGQSSLQ